MWEQILTSLDHLKEKLLGWIDGIVLHLPNLVLSMIVMGIAFIISRSIQKYIQKLLRRVTKNITLAKLGANLATFGIMLIALFIVLGILDLDKALNSLLATAGVAGLAVGLALQDPMVNLFSGVVMSIKKYYKEGDLIKTNEYLGKITSVTLRNTVLLQPDGQEVIIPNKMVVQNPLTNYSHNGIRRVEIICGVSYSDDLDLVQTVVRSAIKENVDYLMPDKAIDVLFYEFGDSSINFRTRFWIDTTGQADVFLVQDQAIRSIKKAFDKEGISIPFPMRTLELAPAEYRQLEKTFSAN